MSTALHEALGALLATTPEPPSADEEPGAIVDRAGRMAEDRAAPFDRLRELVDAGCPLDEPARHLAATLRERDARWSAALARARHLLSDRLVAARRTRACYR
jgi:hypothetical protein